MKSIPHIYKKSRHAFQSWSNLPIKERLHYLKRLRLLIVERMDEIAEVISKDAGKVKIEALVADIMPTIDAIKHIEKHAVKTLSGRKVTTPLMLIGKKILCPLYAPVERFSSFHHGIIRCSFPWFPFLMP
ncbi:aldehyde dehydrogenase family protein [Peribacillus frigoritolerans]|nr:aldehyde dehydrogenase family protein [Peribacillus frigoritolerans]